MCMRHGAVEIIFKLLSRLSVMIDKAPALLCKTLHLPGAHGVQQLILGHLQFFHGLLHRLLWGLLARVTPVGFALDCIGAGLILEASVFGDSTQL